MKKGILILFSSLRKVTYYMLLFATFIFGIGFFLSFVSLFDLGKKQGEHLSLSFKRFYNDFKEVLSQLKDIKSQSFEDYVTNSQVLDGYIHSYTILGISLAIIIVGGSLIAFTVMLSPYKLRKKLQAFLDLFEGLPDLMFIYAINMLNIFLYKEYNMKIFTMYGLGSNQPIAFPVIVISFLPAILFGVFLLKSMEDEEQELYIQVGLSKGLTKGYLYSVHMIRNILPVFMLKFRSILYMLLSNLVLVEFMYFYEQAHTSILIRHVFMDDHVLLLIYSIIMLILPVILFEYLVRTIVKYTVVRKRGEIQL
ncbi:ABC transporter permease [Bacillus sp. JJ1609]|uniref:ABC transporter permease n=1 Tax=Bacillus sp. JJ1609 TaxID=3122977 RepID=UPI002FFF3054